MSTIALVRHKKDSLGKDFIELNIIEEQSGSVEKQNLDLYNMKDIKIPEEQPFNDDAFVAAIRTKEGQKAINQLKAEITATRNSECNFLLSKFINNSPDGKLFKVLTQVINEPLEEDASSTFRSIGLTKKQIWNYFVKNKLV